jgi:DNA modification methylase/superfamily II DNA or RNA helicase
VHLAGDAVSDYSKFLAAKAISDQPTGLTTIPPLNPMLFDFQKDIVAWSLRRGRSAVFADCGMGKTPMQLEWAKHVPGRVLILAPLAVSAQTVREGQKFGVDVMYCRKQADAIGKIVITNYEMLSHFDSSAWAGIVLDESSILKSFDGSTRKEIQEFSKSIPFKLACTATPAPNDLIELTNHAEFLNVMSGKEMIALFFKQDGNTTHQWRLKKHAAQPFYKWLASWAVALRKPSDLGYDDGAFILPPLSIEQVIVGAVAMDGFLLPMTASTMGERRSARSVSVDGRVAAVAGIVAQKPSEPWLVWCDLNKESEALAKAIPGSIEVRGSDSMEKKEAALIGFSSGAVRVLITKPSIAGHGMNWQHACNMVFTGLSDSYEQFYQALRREYRFGQKRPVTAWVVTCETEGAVKANIERKERQSAEMFDQIVRHMNVHEIAKKQERDTMTDKTGIATGKNWTLMLGDSCERIKEIEGNTIGLSVFSPPFPGMYAYTNSPRDIGNCKDFEQLIAHFAFLMDDILRITMPGRACCIHLTQEPVFKGREGYVGLRDFRGDVIRHMTERGWLYYSEVTIDKNPMLKASRTKEGTLLFKTLAKDSAGSRPALADYLLVFKKDGDNPVPVRAGISEKYGNPDGWITQGEWCEWAAPVWYRAMPTQKNEYAPFQASYPSRHQETDGIRETDVLETTTAKDAQDEKHLCPLQLGVIERCVKLWSAPGDTVFSPFAGIGSEGYQAVKLHRKFIGCELKESYFKAACANLEKAQNESGSMGLFCEAVAL